MLETDLHNVVCVIPCAGKGTRMQPLTYTRPKALLPVLNEPILGHILRAVAEAGIRRACLVVSPHDAQTLAYATSHAPAGLSVEQVMQETADGLGHAVLCAETLVDDAPFIVYLGDSLYEDRMQDFAAGFAADRESALLRLQAVDEPQHYGIAVVDSERRVTEVEEKPPHPKSSLAITGLYGFPAGFYPHLRATRPGRGEEIQLTDAIGAYLANGGRVRGEEFTGRWADCGRPYQFLAANEVLLAGMENGVDPSATVSGPAPPAGVRIGPGSVVENVTFGGRVLVGRDCRLTDATICGPCALNDGAVIEGSRVVNAIIDRQARIEGLPGGVVDSIIGIGAHLQGDGGEGRLVGAVAGDGARLRFSGTTARCG